ncbi:MAG TPA: amidohydrolase [Acidimicrobiia bacterium]
MKDNIPLLRRVVDDVASSCVELRRRIHRRPELSNQEVATTAAIAEFLAERGIEARVRRSGVGALTDVGTGSRRVAFRADLDALPIQEATGAPYASEIPGRMHACGHDVHAAIAAGIALTLQHLDLPGSARFIFQHAEEAPPGGAFDLVDEGALEGVEAILAFHVDPSLEVGRVGLRSGAITSSSDRFEITVEGPGGHTARPHETVDTIYAASLITTQLPALLHRLVDSRKPMALVFGQIHGGSADNVIPARVEISGTARALDRELWEELPALVDRLVADIVAPTGAKAVLHYQRGIAPVINSAMVVAEVEFAVVNALGPQAVAVTEPSLGAEDFALYLDKVPGALVRLGVALPDRRALHSSTFDIDESSIKTGILVGAASLLRMMGRHWRS